MLSCLLALGAHVALAPPTTIASFEEPTAEWRVVDASATPVSDHVTEGEFALRVEFEQSDGYPALALGAECLALTDWTGYGAVAFDVFVEGDAELGLNVRLDTKAGGVEAMEQTEVRVRPNRATTVSIALPRELPHMYFGPPALLGDVNGALRSADLDLAAVTGVHIFLLRPETARTIYIDNVRLAPEVPMRDLVDRYGQYANAEWPGKITRDEDLTEDRSQETEWLSHNGRPASFDEYGAWADGPQLDATGWFRTAQVDGKWWLVAPNGKLFWSSGLDCVNTQNGGPIRDRQYLFSWLPEPGDALSRFGSAESAEANFYEINLYRKYGPDFWEPWLARTGERLDAWGFNTIAAWSDQTFHKAGKPYTCTLWTGSGPTIQGVWATIPDVFDPGWPGQARAAIAERITQFRDDPLCIGYFVDNEIAWGYYWHGRLTYTAPINCLAMSGRAPAKRAMVELLQERHGPITALNAAWGTRYKSWDTFCAEPVLLRDGDLAAPIRSDLSMLLTAYAERYFSTVAAAVNEHAPHQLYLGQRFGGIAPAEVVDVAERYCDVVSFNIYGDADNLTAHARHVMDLKKPGIIGEFHFAAMDRGMFGPNVESQAVRAEKYIGYIQRALDLNWCVGAHWFTYCDQPLVGRFDGENSNIGFVSQTDTPYYELIEAARQVNSTMYERRGG